jgi:hypothetical protein
MDGLTFDIKGETIISVEQIAECRSLDIVLPLSCTLFFLYQEVAF